MMMSGLYVCTEDWVNKGIATIKDTIKEIEAPIKAVNEQMTGVKDSITTLTEQMTGVKDSITTLTEQISGDAPPVTAAVTAQLQHVHFELKHGIVMAVWRTRLVFLGHVLIFSMQVAILWMLYNKGQAPPVEAPPLRDVPLHRLLCDVVKRNPHYDGDGVVVCQYLPETHGDGQVIWTAMQSSWTYLQQSLRNMSQTQ